ncbi:MAG: citrate transporter [Gammaproteobacteria bacterium]|nr:citrate transporter [Gammaproteobacteria bacterium]
MSMDGALSLMGFGMVITFMVLIMSRKLSPLVALTLIPLVFALVGGFGGPELKTMLQDGIKTLAPTGVMLTFAILYFGVMTDVGLFDPIVKLILRIAGNDPLKIVVGTAILAAFVSLDGDGSTTYMVVAASMLPLYYRLKINVLNLTCVTMLAGGVMNLTPWGGPLARISSALRVDPMSIFVPLVPVMAFGVAMVFVLAFYLGLQERHRLGVLEFSAIGDALDLEANTGDATVPSEHRRANYLWFNAALTATLLVLLIAGVLPAAALFMVGFAIAITVNFPNIADQRERIAAHARNVLAVVSVIFAAGIFTGVLNGTGMVAAMSKEFLSIIPHWLAPHLAPVTAIASMPFTFFISNDAFYFGVMPIVAEAASIHGIAAAEIARASLIGQPVHLLSPLVPSTYLLAGLAGVEFADHQRFTIGWAALLCVLMTCCALLLGVFPLSAP